MSDTSGPSGALARSVGITDSTSEEALQLQELSLNTRILSTVNPWMGSRPDVLLELAGSGLPPDQLATQGAAMFGMQNMDALREALGGLTAPAQRSVYSKLTETQQRALDQMGYSEPKAESGLAGQVFGALGTVVEPVWGGVSTVGGPVGKGALDILTFVGDQPAHLYRAIRQMESWQQWVALGGATAGIALAIPTVGGSLALSGPLISTAFVGGSALGGASIAAAATNPFEWWEALDNSWDGERVFERGAQRKAREILGGDELVALAKDIALELDPYDMAVDIIGTRGGGGERQTIAALQRIAEGIVDSGTPEYEQVFAGLLALTNEEPFQQAIDTLQRGKISFGRDIADTLQLDPSNQYHSLISGALDGIWIVSMDPTMAAGNIVRWNRIRRFGLGADGGDAFLNRLTHLANTDPLTRSNFETMARAVDTGDFTLMPKEARGHWNSLLEWKRVRAGHIPMTEVDRGPFEIKDVLEYFEFGGGMSRLLEGKGTIRGVEQVVISRRNETAGFGRFVREMRQLRNAMDDVTLEKAGRKLAEKHGVVDEFDHRLPADVLDEAIHTNLVPVPGVAGERAGTGGAFIGRQLRRVPGGRTAGELMASITSMIPGNSAIRIVGEGSEIDIPRFVETFGRALNMPSGIRDEWLNAVMVQGSSAQRLAVIQSFQDTALTVAGMRSNTELAALADRYLHKYAQAFALGGLDRTALNGIPAMTGVLPEAHQASLVVVPNLLELHKAVRRGHLLKHVARVTDSNFVEASMSRYWKPMVLMRIGFVPRAAGEEMLAWFARMTEGAIAQEFAARSLGERGLYNDAQRLLAEGANVAQLSSAHRKALDWELPTHVRPLVRMASRLGWADPTEAMLDNYGQALRGFLEDGIGYRIPDVEITNVGKPILGFQRTKSDQWYHGLLYGRAKSWRRMIANGVDPNLRRAADRWALDHADALMRSASAMNASILEKSVMAPDVDMMLAYDPQNPGKLVEEPMITLRGERQRATQIEPRYAAGLHHRVAEPFDDRIIGPILQDMYPQLHPQFPELQRSNIVEAIELGRKAENWTSQKLLLEALQPREDNWRAVTELIREHQPRVAEVLDDALLKGDVAWSDLIEGLGRQIDLLDEPTDIAALASLQRQLEDLAPLVDGMGALGPHSRAWMAQTLSADIGSGGRAFNLQQMQKWRDGATETVARRPERVFYRGVKSGETYRILPNGDLALTPQWQQGWAGEVVSMSLDPQQSLSYAVTPGQFNEGGDIGRGAMIEIDGDFILNHYNTTMDEVFSRPVQNMAKQGDPGVHYVDKGVDRGEISVVTRLSSQNEQQLDTLKTELASLDELISLSPTPSRTAYRNDLEREIATLQAQIGFDGSFEDRVSALRREIEDMEAIIGRDPTSEYVPVLAERKADLEVLLARPVQSDDFIIPAGSWSIQNEDQMEQIVAGIRDGAETRFPWLTDVSFRTQSGKSIETFTQDVITEYQDIVRGLPRSKFNAVQFDAEHVERMADYLERLDPDDLQTLSQIIGYRLRADVPDFFEGKMEPPLRNFARELLRNGDHHFDDLAESIAVRGQGGFFGDVPAWSPFFEDMDSFWRAFEERTFASLLRPENAEHVRASRFALETADGRKVAQPMQEGVRRIYQPTIGPKARIADRLEEGMTLGLDDDALVAWLVDDLLDRPETFRLHTDFVRRLSQTEREQILEQSVRAYLRRGENVGWTRPLFGVGYDDPRAAQWAADVLTGSAERAPGGLAYTDVPRSGISSGDNIHGVTQTGAHGNAGASWQLDEQRDYATTMINDDGVVMMPDGSHSAGAPYTEALRDYARTITRKVKTEHGQGTKEMYRPLAATDDAGELSTLTRQRGGELVPVRMEERFGTRQDLFDADGNPVEFGDPKFFQPEATTSDELMWPIIGPMVRDRAEKRAGLGTTVAKTSPQQGRSLVEGARAAPLDEQFVTMTRSRIDDVFGPELDLPNVALTEVRTPAHDTLWDRGQRFFFDKVAGPAIDALVRKPMTFHHYAIAEQQNRQFLGWLLDKNLFNTQIPRAFASQLDLLDNATTMTAGQIDDARHLARSFMGVDDLTDIEAGRWLVSLGADDAAVFSELQKMMNSGIRSKDNTIRAAAERLMEVETNPLRLVGIAGEGPAAHRLVRAYHDAIPEEIWMRGRAAVNKHLRSTDIGLPLLETSDQWQIMLSARNNYAHVDNTIYETAKLRALENVIPFLDSHEQRTQFASTTKNLLPFWYAEENFLKRWARTMAIDGTVGLSTLRKAQLSYMGLRSSGLVRTDANGKDWFVYPGSGLLSEAIAKLPFVPDTLPVGIMFQAATDSMMPGVNSRFGTPSVSPWAALPVDAVTTLFPDAVPIKRAILGDIGASKSAITQFVPTTVQRVWETAFKDETSSNRYASAMMAAAAFMDAEGTGLPDSATPDQMERYLERLRNHARIVMIAQTISGFVVPGSPIAINTGENVGSFGWLTGLGVDSPDEIVSERYRGYVQNLGIEAGTQQFLADFPNADLEDVINPLAFTVASSTSVSGAPLPATRTGLKWYTENQGWVDSQPEAGAWFLPPDSDGEFDYYSYSQQLVSGLRKRRDPEDFIRSLKYRQGASAYFDAKDQYELAVIAAGTDTNRKQMLDDVWETWRTTWLGANPIFAEELVSGDARERRARTIDQLRYAIDDPAAPPSPSLDAIAEMSRGFDAYKVAMMRVNESRSADSRKRARAIKQIFEEWATAWTLRNPDIEQLWSAVFRPEALL